MTQSSSFLSLGRPSSRTVSQSLSEIPALFTLVLLTCVSVCICVSMFILRQWIWEKWQCGVALCQSPSKVACVSALLTDALVLLPGDGGCKCGTCLVTERHSLHDNSACRQDTSSQVWCEEVTAEGPGSQRVSEGCSDLCTAGDAGTMLHLAYRLVFLNGFKRNLFLSEMGWCATLTPINHYQTHTGTLLTNKTITEKIGSLYLLPSCS